MAGGKGTRLRPLTCDLPKPMVPLLNRPVMDYAIELLQRHNITDIAVTTGYLAEAITSRYGDGSSLGINIRYYHEEKPLGTGGSVKNAASFVDGTFVVLSGDALTDLDLAAAIAFHRQRKAAATLVLKREAVPLEYGVVMTDSRGKIQRFLEKPGWGEVFSDTINTGIYILEPKVLDSFARGKNFDFSKDLFPKLLAQGEPLYGYVTDGYWCDIGDLATYRQTQFDMLDNRVVVNITGRQLAPGIWIGEECEVAEDVELIPPIYIGSHCQIGSGVRLGPYTIVNDGCIIQGAGSLARTVVWKNTRIGQRVEARGATIAAGVALGRACRLYENSVVGDNCVLGPGVTVRPDIKIWPEKRIEAATRVSHNLVWGTRASKTLFGARDISGNFNTELTADQLVRLGTAWASMHKDTPVLFIGSDDTTAAQLAAQALATGAAATGARIVHSRGLATPVTRFAVQHFRADGGVNMRLSVSERDRLHLEFFDHRGANLTRDGERKLENQLATCDFRLAPAARTRLPSLRDDAVSAYFQAGAKRLDASAFARQRPRVLIASRSQSVLFLATAYLDYLGCQVDTVSGGGQPLTGLIGGMSRGDYHLGLLLREDGQQLALVDQEGRVLAGPRYLALATRIALAVGLRHLVLPATAPGALIRMAREEGAQVELAKSAPAHLLTAMLDQPQGELQATLFFDAIRAPGLVLDHLLGQKLDLAHLAATLPDFYYRQRTVPCAQDDKGRVLRLLAREPDTVGQGLEGIRFDGERGWALVLPDGQRPAFRIYVDGFNEEYAQELADFYTEKVKSMLSGS